MRVPASGLRARLAGIDKQRLMSVVLIIVASIALLYLLAANVILRTRLLRGWVGDGPDVELEYASAYSVWPGLVHIRGLQLAVQTYTFQLSVSADSGVVHVSLNDLLFTRFRATHVSLQGLSFRLRDRVSPAESETARVAAYPSVWTFSDPPLRVGKKPDPTPDEGYDLWEVVLEDIAAEVRELWFFEYRYVGAGVAQGTFKVQPGKSFDVAPASVTLDGGVVSVGESVAVSRLQLGVDGRIDFVDVRQSDDRQLVEKIFGHLRLEAALDLAALDSRYAERGAYRVLGDANLVLDAVVDAGRLVAGSSAKLTSDALSVFTPYGKLSGGVSSALEALPDRRLDWTTTSSRLALSNSSEHAGPVFGSPRLQLALRGDELAAPFSIGSLELEVPSLVVPSLRWAERWFRQAGLPFEVGGRLEGRAKLELAPERGPAARVQLRLVDAALSSKALRAAFGGSIDADVRPQAGARASTAGKVDIQLDGVAVEHGAERRKPFQLGVRLPNLTLSLDPEPALSSRVEVNATPADSLMALALGEPILRGLAADVLGLRQLEARAQVDVNARAVRVELSSAESGALSGTGFWQRPALGDAKGAFLISSKMANVGISMVGSDTEMSWFVPNDWLSSGAKPKPAAPSRRAR